MCKNGGAGGLEVVEVTMVVVVVVMVVVVKEKLHVVVWVMTEPASDKVSGMELWVDGVVR